jgi:hypothetical protein
MEATVGFEIATTFMFFALMGGYVWGVRDGQRHFRDDKAHEPVHIPEPTPLTGESISVLMQNAIDRANTRPR